MEIKFSIAYYITLYMLPTSQAVGMSSERTCISFTVCLLANCYSDVNTTAKRWCILLKGTNII
jgi:hypothetical protein